MSAGTTEDGAALAVEGESWAMPGWLAQRIARRRDEDRARHAPYIARALAAGGGHLAVGPAGGTLHLGPGATLSGFSAEEMGADCEAAGLCVLDASAAPSAVAWALVGRGPMVAVGEPPDPPPWGAFSRAPLAVVADAYRRAGARVANAPPIPPGSPPLDLARLGVPEVAPGLASDLASGPASRPAAPSTPDGSTDP